MADSTDYKVAKKRQTDRTTPASGSGAHYVSRSDGGMEYSISRAVDPTVRPDDNVVDNVATNQEGSYSITSPMGWDRTHEEIEDAMRSTAIAQVSVTGTDLAAVASGNKVNSSSTDLSGFNALRGFPVRVSGFAQLSTPRYARVVSATATELVLEAGWLTLSDEAVGPSVTIESPDFAVVPGTTKHWSTFEEEFQPGDLQLWKAMLCESWGFSWGEIHTNQFSYRPALRAVTDNGAPATSSVFSSPTAPPNTPSIGARHVNVLREGGGAKTLGLMSFDFSVQNSLTGDQPAGGLGARDFARAKRAISGNLSVYNDADAIAELHAMINRARNDEPTELAWQMQAPAASPAYLYWFIVGAAQYNGATRNPGGEGNNVSLAMPWVSKVDSYGHMFYVAGFDLT